MSNKLTLLLPNFWALLTPILNTTCPKAITQELRIKHPSALSFSDKKPIDPYDGSGL